MTAALPCAAVLLSGCSVLGGGSSSSASPSSAAVAVASPGTTSTVAAGAPAASVTAAPLPVLAAADTANETGLPLKVAINEFRVSGQLLQLTWTVSNASTADQSWSVDRFFSNQVIDPKTNDADAYTRDNYSVDGVYLLDTAGAKRYLVARDENKVCACTTGLNSIRVAAGSSLTFTATFKAPPAEVTTMRVVIPNVRPLDLPVQR